MARLPFHKPSKGGEKTRKKQPPTGMNNLSTDVLASVNNFLGGDLVRLRDCQGYTGILRGIRKDGDAYLADFARPVEISEAVAAELQDLIGQRVIIANVAGKIRAGRRST